MDLPDPGIKPGLLHCRQILYELSYQGCPNRYGQLILVKDTNGEYTMRIHNGERIVFLMNGTGNCVHLEKN